MTLVAGENAAAAERMALDLMRHKKISYVILVHYPFQFMNLSGMKTRKACIPCIMCMIHVINICAKNILEEMIVIFELVRTTCFGEFVREKKILHWLMNRKKMLKKNG